MLTVAKFGGTSMGSASAINEVAVILKDCPHAVAAIVSATSGTTDTLIKLGQEALTNGPWEQTFQELIAKHQKIIETLDLNCDLSSYYEEIINLLKGINLIGELSLSARDRLIGFGERISSQILTELLRKNGLQAQAIDAYQLIFTDNNFSEGNTDFAKTDTTIQKTLQPLLQQGIIPVITGFIGQAENGQYITLGRGGSDYSAAIVAGALNADVLEIWTDVDGMYEADPRVIAQAHLLEQLSFHEASELAYFGAKVLHPKTIKPAINKNIPVKILDTFNRQAQGTLITNDETPSLKSVTSKKNITIINICSTGMLDAHGFLARIFDVFARHHKVVDVVATSEVSVSLTVDKGDYSKVIAELENFATVNMEENMAIVCLVGSGIRSSQTVLRDLFGCLSEHVVNMVSQGASQRNITFLVKESQAQAVVTKIFTTFFESSKREHRSPGNSAVATKVRAQAKI